jgi:hypothetical protein
VASSLLIVSDPAIIGRKINESNNLSLLVINEILDCLTFISGITGKFIEKIVLNAPDYYALRSKHLIFLALAGRSNVGENPNTFDDNVAKSEKNYNIEKTIASMNLLD